MVMSEVTPAAGFSYFSGHYRGDDSTSRDLPTIYYAAGFDSPRVIIVGPGVQVEYPIKRIDEALQIYKLICLQRAAEWTPPEELLALANALVRALDGTNNVSGIPEAKLRAFLKREITYQDLFDGSGRLSDKKPPERK
jgi:hypothetical protein